MNRARPAATASAASWACWWGVRGMAGCSLRMRFPLMATFKSIGDVTDLAFSV